MGVIPCSFLRPFNSGVPVFVCFVKGFNVGFTPRSPCTVFDRVSLCWFLFAFDTVVVGGSLVMVSCFISSTSCGIAFVDSLFVVPAAFLFGLLVSRFHLSIFSFLWFVHLSGVT